MPWTDAKGEGSIAVPELLKHVSTASGDFLEIAQFMEDVVASLDQIGDGTIDKCVASRR